MKKVFLYAYDRQNLGDDLFVHTITKRYPHVKFYMWSDRKNRENFRCLPNLRILEKQGAVVRLLDRIRPSFVARYRHWWEKRCQATVYIGGSIFIEYDNWEHSLNWWEYMAQNRSLYVMGANFGPYHTEAYREKMAQIYAQMKDVCFRDQYSYDLFRQVKTVRQAPDILFSYPMPEVSVTKKQIFVSVIDCVGRDAAGVLEKYDDQYVKNMAAMLQAYLDDDYTLVLASFCKAEGDERGAEKVLCAMGCKEDSRISFLRYDGTNANEMVAAIASSEYVIATRFHAMVLALAAGRPVLPIVYSDKTRYVLNDIGFEGVVFDLRKDQVWSYDRSKYNLEKRSFGIPEDLKEGTQDHFIQLDGILKADRAKKSVFNMSNGRGCHLQRIIQAIRCLLSGKTKGQLELELLLKHGMTLGKNSNILSNCKIDSGWPWLVSIGDDVTIAPNVTILAHDASPNVVKCGTKLGRVSIGNNVFVGANTTILCNSRIGDNVVIGAGSLVTGEIPSNGVYAGVPAVKIASIEEYREKLERLREKRPHFDQMHPWHDWKEASEEDKEFMKKSLEDGVGFV